MRFSDVKRVRYISKLQGSKAKTPTFEIFDRRPVQIKERMVDV